MQLKVASSTKASAEDQPITSVFFIITIVVVVVVTFLIKSGPPFFSWQNQCSSRGFPLLSLELETTCGSLHHLFCLETGLK